MMSLHGLLPPAHCGRPLLLRWLETLAEHPWRTLLALALIWVALRRGPRRAGKGLEDPLNGASP